MKLQFEPFTVQKRFPLRISRGTTAQSTNIWVKISQDGIEGWGEVSSFSLTNNQLPTTSELLRQLTEITPQLEVFDLWERQKIEEFLKTSSLPSCLKAGIDVAIYDWWGKSLGLPLWRLWGLDKGKIKPISVTIGISTPEIAQKRLKAWQEILDVQLVKVKLGNPEGIDADKKMLLALKELIPDIPLTVDANGGWNLADGITMCQWLASLGVEYVEQPLAKGKEENLAKLRQESPLPIFIDESCCNSADLVRLAADLDGVNLKLMKAGGISEILSMIYIAKALDKKIMYGCYSDSSLANTAMSHLAPLADYLDLDSHLNLVAEPFCGAKITEGRLLPPDLPGLGVQYCAH